MVKRFFSIITTSVLFFTLTVSSYSQINKNIDCFSVIVGKKATVNNSVLLAHNEDDWGELLVNWYKVPSLSHPTGSKITLQKGAIIDQVPQTYSYLWIQMPGMKFSDSYMNEWGVTIASNQCLSRENNANIDNGGIGFYLRRIMAERSKTAKEAVKIAGKLVESIGYNYSGRTYCVADKNEAWMMAVVKGKHWVAQRIPDDEVAIIPNCYTIGQIDLSDTLNFLGSKDIYDYAIDRGWYDPASKKDFSFKKAYARPGVLKSIWNTPRYMTAVNMLAENKMHYYDDFPFSFQPDKKLNKKDIMQVLKSHLEGTDFESCQSENNSNPHENVMSRICSPGNQYGFVAELRNGLPKEIADVMWIAVKRPCIQPFIPWYFGIRTVPNEFTFNDYRTAIKTHFTSTDLKEKTKDKAYWYFKELADLTDKNYYNSTYNLKAYKEKTENKLIENQNLFENKFLEIYNNDINKAIDYLNQYQLSIITSNLNNTKAEIKSLK